MTARGTYRRLLRAVNDAFRDDHVAIAQARSKIRTSFSQYRHVSDPAQVAALIQDANDTAQFVAQRVVQTVVRDATANPDVRKADVYVRARPGMVDGEIATVADAKRAAALQHERALKKERRRAAEQQQQQHQESEEKK